MTLNGLRPPRWSHACKAGVAGVGGEGADPRSSLVSTAEETRVHEIAGKDRGTAHVEGSHHWRRGGWVGSHQHQRFISQL